MFDLKDLYQEVIVDHNRSPRNFGKLEEPDRTLEGYNPLCGDKLMLYLVEEDDIIKDVCFDGVGCAISVASASLMTEALKGKTRQQALDLFDAFRTMMTAAGEGEYCPPKLGKLCA